jgi:uncharacterized DUF497 family protein
MTMRFEWDAAKSRINQRKHNGLDFETAALLLVVHVYREDEVDGEEIIRIISAREADQRERRIYLQQAAE